MAFLVVHCRKNPDDYDVYVGRANDGRGKWGNPYTHLPLTKTKATFIVGSVAEAVEQHKLWIKRHPEWIELAQKELKGKVLGCFCGDFDVASLAEPWRCHGQTLSVVANQIEPYYSEMIAA